MAKKPDTRTQAQKNRALRQDELRKMLSERCRVQHVLENIEKLEDVASDMEAADVNRIKIANEQRIKLIGKYLPDLKQSENHNINENVDRKPIDEMTPEEKRAELAELKNVSPIR